MKLGRILCYDITGLELKDDERSVSILLCCLSNKIYSWETPVWCWYGPGAETCLSHDEQCPVPKGELSRVVTSAGVKRLFQLSRDDFSKTPETVCWTAGNPYSSLQSHNPGQGSS